MQSFRSLKALALLICFFGCLTAWSQETAVEEAEEPVASDVPAPPPEGKARFVAVTPEVDFGLVRASHIEPITVTFQFKNAGTEVLTLTRIEPSCACTSVRASATDTAPGGTGSITAALVPKGAGPQSITVRVNSNDPTNPVQVFKVTGTILADWRIIPLRMELGSHGEGETLTKEIQVNSQYQKGEKVYKIVRLQADSPDVRAVTAPPGLWENPEPGREYNEVQRKVQATITTGQKRGARKQNLTLYTDDPQSPTHTITFEWKVEGDLSFTPERVFAAKTATSNNPKDLTLASRSGKPFEVISIEVLNKQGAACEDLDIAPKQGSTPVKKIYGVSVKFQPEKASETHAGEIVFKTNSEDQPVVRVPYTASARMK
jgi:hypothetical protein